MELIAAGGLFVLIGVIAVVAIIVLIIVLIFVRAWYKVAKADQALVVVGKSQKNASGGSSRISIITGGGALVNPLTQRAEMISLRARQIKMEPTAQASNGVTVNVSGVALVKIGSDPEFVRRAAERFLSQDGAIEQFTTEQLEGALRGVVATLTVEQLMKDRQKLSDQIAEGIKSDLLSQGLILDSFQIQGITDQNGYIDALGATEVERVRREAEVARINAAREVRARQIATDEANLIEQTAYDKNSAAASAEVGRARAEAEQAEALARAEREQAVLLQQAENKQAQLDADIKKVADADLYQRQREADAAAYAEVKAAEARAEIAAQEAEATRLRAQADADAVRLAGEARALAIEAEAEALSRNQEALLAQRALESLVPMMTEFARGYDKVGSITVLSGEGASQHIAAESAAGMRATFDTVEAVTGIDLRQIIQGQAVGRGVAQGMERRDASVPATRRAAARATAPTTPSRETAVADAAAGGTGAAGADLTGGANAASPRLSDPAVSPDGQDGLSAD